MMAGFSTGTLVFFNLNLLDLDWTSLNKQTGTEGGFLAKELSYRLEKKKSVSLIFLYLFIYFMHSFCVILLFNFTLDKKKERLPLLPAAFCLIVEQTRALIVNVLREVMGSLTGKSM